MSDLRPDEQVISQAIELGLSTQIETAEALNVEVHTDLLKVAQGEADSVAIDGKGVVLQPDVRVEQMALRTDRLAINPLSALLGQVKFKEPLNAQARMVLTSDDLNRAMNSDFVQSKLAAIDLVVEGVTIPIEMQPPLAIDLSVPGKMRFSGTMLAHYPDGIRPTSFTAVCCPRQGNQPPLLESFDCQPGQGVTIPFTIALMQKAQDLLKSPYLGLEGMILHIKELTVIDDSLILSGEALLAEIPAM
ncbi:MAG: DUF2993 domain-containing protein [Leptolyngbyaceae cyanobacterium SM1_3_5]|nr:DUF2993 domain-containing protein [Leptolyngbyaceae cyanobacterium SM1_3_5]